MAAPDPEIMEQSGILIYSEKLSHICQSDDLCKRNKLKMRFQHNINLKNINKAITTLSSKCFCEALFSSGQKINLSSQWVTYF
jgi:hypothetical protein